MKNLKYLSLFLVVCILVGCGEKKIENRPLGPKQKINEVVVFSECLEGMFSINTYKSCGTKDGRVLLTINGIGNYRDSENRNFEIEENLKRLIWDTPSEIESVFIHVVNDAVEEFAITANRTLFGKAPGEKLNDHFYARTWSYNNPCLLSFPEMDKISVIDGDKWTEIDELVGSDKAMVGWLELTLKEVPTEFWGFDYEEITFTISQRLVSGKEFSNTHTIRFTEPEEWQW